MWRSLGSGLGIAARLVLQQGAGSLGAALAPEAASLSSRAQAALPVFRAGFSSAAQTACRIQGAGPCLHASAAAGAATAAAATAAARSATAAAAWRAATAAAMQQQARGYARYLQFQPRGGGGWGSGGSGWGSDQVLWGLIGVNVAGFMLWRVAPREVSGLPVRAAPLCHT